jgi:heat shock protein HslJ
VSTRPLARLAGGLALLAVFVAAGCAAAVTSLGEREFLSVAVTDGGAARPLVAGTRIRLTFSGTNLGASAGCNSIGGSYRIEGGRLVFEGGGMTEMGCDAERHAQDDWLVALLASNPTVRLAGSDLTLESGSVAVSLRDREVVEPDANIVGPTWTVESIITGDAVSSVPAGATATLVFNADGTISVRPGCNQGGGTWKPIAGGIEVSALVLTKMACDGPGGQLESAVLEVLDQGTLAASIDSTVLTLQAGGRGLQLRAG